MSVSIPALKAELAKPAYAGLADNEATALANMAALLSAVHAVSVVTYPETFATKRTIAKTLGLAAAEAFVTKLTNAAPSVPGLGMMLPYLDPGADGIDVGNATTRQQLTDLAAAGVLDQVTEVDPLLALGQHTDTPYADVAEGDIIAALRY